MGAIIELLQNAVDACRERWAIEGEQYRGLVTVNVDKDANGEKLFTITDNGIGMTEDVILNYFLKAGSTYRNSDEWKMTYGEKGVIRNGQFGIGVLAAFILGDEVRVSTVPRSSTIGYRFAMRRDDYGTIDIARESFAKDSELRSGGTRIEVVITNPEDVWDFPDTIIDPHNDQSATWRAIRNETFHNDRSDILVQSCVSPFIWYWPDSMENLELPTVEYCLFGTKLVAPIALDQVTEWFELPAITGIKRMQWWPESPDGNPYFRWYNHLYVPEIAFDARIWDTAHFPPIRTPRLLSVEDTENQCTINLERTELQIPIAAEIKLYIENVKLYLAKLMMAKVGKIPKNIFFPPELVNSVDGIEFLFSKYGFAMQNSYIADQLVGKTVWFITFRSADLFRSLDTILDEEGVYIFRRVDSTRGLIMPYNSIHRESVMVLKERLYRIHSGARTDIGILRQSIEEDYNVFKKSNSGGKEIRTLSMEGSFDKLSYYTDNYQACTEGNKSFLTLFDKNADERFSRPDFPPEITEHAEGITGFKIVDSRQGLGSDQPDELREMDERIMKLLKYYFEHDAGKDPWIPYDPKERRKKFPRFFDPEDDMYKYMKYVDRHCDRKIYYSLKDFETEEA